MKTIEFIKSVFNVRELPENDKCEIILCGRSNVGKSSFINSVFAKKNIAKVSSSPGKTKCLNYYLVEEKFYLLDLPGFGYAKVSKKEREFWQKLISDYFSTPRNRALAFHFIDSRHKPTELDVLLNKYLYDNNIPYVVLLSKVDKLNQSEFAQSRKRTMEEFKELIWGENLLPHSAIKGTGKKEILSRIYSLFDK